MHGLVALMEIQASRLAARGSARRASRSCCSTRTARAGTSCSIRRGLAALERAEALGGALGPYALQAAIAACHARARTAAETDWARIAALYDALAQLAPSPIVELNRAVAVGDGVRARRPAWRSSTRSPASRRSRATTCCRACAAISWQSSAAGDEARAEFERAAALTRNARERALLLERAAGIEGGKGGETGRSA